MSSAQADCSAQKRRKAVSHDSPLDLAAIRRRLSSLKGAQYWRSLEELAASEVFQDMLHREFPSQASEFSDPVGRRQFLKLMGASLALAGVTACTKQPPEKIVPYVRQPEEIVPGKPLFFATAMPLGGTATGLLVESQMGRPIKVEGNPDHPQSLGATDIYAQAAILSLYDPDRSQTLTYLGEIRPWSAFVGAIRSATEAKKATGGAGLRILTESVLSPTLGYQLEELLASFPAARWHQYEPVGRDTVRAGAQMAIGRDAVAHYRFDRADVILSLDGDFLACGPGTLPYVRAFSDRRRISNDASRMNRLYVIESTPSATGAMADHRWAMKPSQIELFARMVAAQLGIGGPAAASPEASRPGGSPDQPDQFVPSIVRDLQHHRGRSLIVAGEQQPAIVHALAHGMNQALGNVGSTVVYADSAEVRSEDHLQSIRQLVLDMEASQVDMLVILAGNPVYTVPADLEFADRLSKVALRIHLGQYEDETSELCHWHIPEAHFLESWSDARAHDGTLSIIQPLIAPLYNGKSAHEVVAVFSDRPERSGYDIVREYWTNQFHSGGKAAPRSKSARPAVTAPGLPAAPQPPVPTQQAGGAEFERVWRRALHDGVVPTSLSPRPSAGALAISVGTLPPASAPAEPAHGLEIVFRPDPTIYDGRFANNGWLQELPKPLTKLTWDNAIMVSPATAERLGLQTGVAFQGGEHGQSMTDVVELQYKGRSVRGPIWIVPGQADDCVTVHLGYGRRRAGHVGAGVGFNAYAIRTSDAPWFGSGVELLRVGEQYPLACTQKHQTMEGRDFVRAGTAEEFKRNPLFAPERIEEPPRTLTLYPNYKYEGYAWGMAIDINACVGCNACVVACQAENNIPVVGKQQVLRGREMHWLRVDLYYKGGLDNPEVFHQPVPCMHCENAPCELVCPVAATVHSSEGLNDMVYHRCVGTRYCSNNCPYKVRRFNFLLYSDWDTPSLKLARNPDVTVRSRGVMEKCTYCVQRINAAKIQAEIEQRTVRDGEIETACQAACPAEAIVFGNINDPNSRVAQLKAQSRNYGLLGELNTRPRTTYLAAVRNPNPEIGESSARKPETTESRG